MPRTDRYNKWIHFPASDVRFNCPHQIFSSKERVFKSLKNHVGKNSGGKKAVFLQGHVLGTGEPSGLGITTQPAAGTAGCRRHCRLHCICYSFLWARVQITAGQSWLRRQKADHSCLILAGCLWPLSETPRKPVPGALRGLDTGSSKDASSRVALLKRCQSNNFSWSAPRGDHEGQVLSLAEDWIKFWGCYTYPKQ